MSGPSETPKRVRLALFLEELVRLRSRSVADLGSYEQVLWLGRVPDDDECFSRHREPENEDDPDIWLEIRKPREPRLAKPPPECDAWVGERDQDDLDAEPRLRETILSPAPMPDESIVPTNDVDAVGTEGFAGAHTELHLDDYPHVKAAWEDYIERHWRPWAALRRRWNVIQSKYAKLFEIYSHVQTRGEQVELVLGVGLLSWRVAGYGVRRHVVTARVDLVFDEERARFQIRPHSAGVQLSIELDMLPAAARPTGMERSAREGLKAAEDDIWDRGAIDPVLEAVAHRLSELGEYDPDPHGDARAPGEHPVVYYAPALFLRKRSDQSVQAFLRRMREQLESDGNAPDGWRDLCEEASTTGGESTNRDTGHPRVPDHEPYLPLPTNDEQRRILRALDHPIGALVQGPPGTGKSHTIANLTCHLLATGRRILITAQTPRALLVLREKLPEEIRPLAVSLLGFGVDERQSLEESVNGITRRFDAATASQYRQRAIQLEKNRHRTEERISRLSHQRRALRERDTMVHDVAGHTGTAEAVAKRVAADADRFRWLSDEVHYDSSPPLPLRQIRDALGMLRRLSAGDRDQLGRRRPAIGQMVPTGDEFRSLIERERDAQQVLSSYRQHDAEPPPADRPEALASLRRAIEALQQAEVAIANAGKRPQVWVRQALEEILTKRDRPWFELQLATEEVVAGVRDTVREEDRRSVTVPAGIGWAQIRSDAEVLLAHLRSGARLRFWFTKSPSVKRCRYLAEAVRIDGRLCADPMALQTLSRHADVHLSLQHIQKLWGDRAATSSSSLAMQVREVEELQEALASVLAAYRQLEIAMEALGDVSGISEPAWHERASRAAALSSLRTRVAQIDLLHAQRSLARLEDELRVLAASSHADQVIVDQLLAAVQQRDIAQYGTICETIHRLDHDAAQLCAADAALTTLAQALPRFVHELRSSPSAAEWDQRLDDLESAINHARARHWLRTFIEGADSNAIESELRRQERQRCKELTEETANLAWAHAFERMEESHRRALMAWQQAMKAGGKFTGKYASRHRREAQAQLHKCRPAIPAWIMPLHRVFDSIDPQPGMFDVIIVDEASQCGPDALPLFYIGKKVLIVGDDKQISPSHVGVDREHVHQRIREFLSDFEHEHSFGLERSLFDHGELRIGNRVVLREHFRCMPEIIRFSNDLCYETTPLIPLRQYASERLDPLVARHVPDGVREGSSTNAINRTEAQRLVKAVVECCRDPRYTREGEPLTFGVISLQGWTQAQHIEHLLLEEIGAEAMAHRRLVCGDAYSFQGDERDVVFLSMVAAPNARLAALTRFEYHQRFNVAASRARDQLWLFHSVMPNELSEECVRRRLLEHFLDPSRTARDIADLRVEELQRMALRANRQLERPPEPFESWFEVDVALRIAARGLRVVPQVEVGGYRIDVVIEGPTARLAVECDGDTWHGPDSYEADVARQRKLERAGWTFVRVRGSLFYASPEEAMRPVWERLDALGIRFTGAATPGASASIFPHPVTYAPPGVEPDLRQEAAAAGEVASAGGPMEAEVVPDREADERAWTLAAPQVEPYIEWNLTQMRDPRKAATAEVLRCLLSIIDVEGPVMAVRAYGLYAKAAGLQRIDSTLRSVFDKAVAKALRDGSLSLELEKTDARSSILFSVLRRAGTATVRPRTAGSRTFGEIPPSEVAWTMEWFLRQCSKVDDEGLYRLVLEHYGLQGLRGPTRDRLVDIHRSLLEATDGNDTSLR